MVQTYTQKHIHLQQHFIAEDTYSPIYTIALWPGVLPHLKLTKVKIVSELNTLPDGARQTSVKTKHEQVLPSLLIP